MKRTKITLLSVLITMGFVGVVSCDKPDTGSNLDLNGPLPTKSIPQGWGLNNTLYCNEENNTCYCSSPATNCFDEIVIRPIDTVPIINSSISVGLDPVGDNSNISPIVYTGMFSLIGYYTNSDYPEITEGILSGDYILRKLNSYYPDVLLYSVCDAVDTNDVICTFQFTINSENE